MTEPWTLINDESLEIVGQTDAGDVEPRAVALVLHGYKGYKDYGMLPVLADRLARAGVLCHRFNFSCSGMTDDVATFRRPDLFERDTWNRQVADVRAVVDDVAEGRLPGRGRPLHLVGHSRGGATALLTAGRHAETLDVAGVVTINAPASCCRLDADARRDLLERGWRAESSARTGQTLRVGRAWLSEQLDDPDGHDPVAQAARLRCPLLVVHADADETVPHTDADAIAGAAHDARVVKLPAGTHVLNTPNPADVAAEPSPQLRAAIRAIGAFIVPDAAMP